eukprot:gene17251-18975_t
MAILPNTSATNSTRTTAFPCCRTQMTMFIFALAVMACPMQTILVKVLVKKFHLRLPRHKILLSLTISDSIQIILLALLQVAGTVFHLKATTFFCQVIRKLTETISVVTTLTSSGSIIALSFERYVACIHCFRYHKIITDELINVSLGCIWVFSVLLGLTDPDRYIPNFTLVSLPLSKTFCIIYAGITLSSTVIVLYVQIRLYILSSKKNKVSTNCSYGRGAEESDLRNRQLKLSFIASGIVAMYVLCMCPLAFYGISTKLEHIENDRSKIRMVCIVLAAANTFIDPFLYGFGMSDTRVAIIKEIRKIKSFVISLMPNLQ